ncbi:hypothetical protein [uncultured Psychrobacter sp.]|uniref:hypothetical protein n=1 Tax=uncultured Psychrobacter sp. TaxID=259303 RepID=UPI002608E9BA|nr:hypothetical protein [uncultured Psychrobacter sp.]
MSSHPLSFELYRYQILPIDRFLQGDLFNDIGSIEELISRKNEFFKKALEGTTNFSSGRQDTITQKLYEDENFYLFKIAYNKSMHRETKDFRAEVIDHWPSLLVAIWNDPEKQFIAVQRRTTAVSSTEVVVKTILASITPILESYHLRAVYESLFEKQKFWSLLHRYEGRIRSLEFELITPNMANISSSLSEDLKMFAKATNSIKNELKIQSDPKSSLHLDEENPTLQGLVEYSSEGGGNISLKIEGINRKVHTSKTVKEVSIEGLEVNNSNASELSKIIKELLR